MPNLYCYFRLYLRHVMSRFYRCSARSGSPGRVYQSCDCGFSPWAGAGRARLAAQCGGAPLIGFSPWDEEQPVRVNLLYRILVCV